MSRAEDQDAPSVVDHRDGDVHPHGGVHPHGDGSGHGGGDDGQDAYRGDEDQPAGASRSGRGALHGAIALVRETGIVIVLALVLSFIVKSLLLQAFYIPSGSMEDTLVRDDRVIVSKLTPGPIDLKRGDIVVFADPGDWLPPVIPVERTPVMSAVHEGLTFVGLLPDDAENHLIKRVIGLPGDHIVCCDDNGSLLVNDVPINEPYLKPGVSPSDMDFDITVPAGKVWVMGDNRSNSADSRFHPQGGDGTEGSVSQDLIVGRAVALVWPFNRVTLLSNPSETFARVPDASSGGQGGDTTSSSQSRSGPS